MGWQLTGQWFWNYQEICCVNGGFSGLGNWMAVNVIADFALVICGFLDFTVCLLVQVQYSCGQMEAKYKRDVRRQVRCQLVTNCYRSQKMCFGQEHIGRACMFVAFICGVYQWPQANNKIKEAIARRNETFRCVLQMFSSLWLTKCPPNVLVGVQHCHSFTVVIVIGRWCEQYSVGRQKQCIYPSYSLMKSTQSFILHIFLYCSSYRIEQTIKVNRTVQTTVLYVQNFRINYAELGM